MELDARIGAGPRRKGNLLPQLARLHALVQFLVFAARQVPIGVFGNGAQKTVRHPHGVVRVLAGHRHIGFGIPIGVVGAKIDAVIALLGEGDDALDVIVGNVGLARGFDFALQRRVEGRIEAIIARALAIAARPDDGVQMFLSKLGAGDQRRHLLLLDDLPIDEIFDIGVIDVDDHHLGGAARGAARFDGARRAVADLQKAHQARGLPAARERLVLAAQTGEIRARAGAVFEQARLARPQIHDAALVHQIVGDALDEAGVGLRMLIGRGGADELTALEVHVIVALARAIDAVGPIEAGICGELGAAFCAASMWHISS